MVEEDVSSAPKEKRTSEKKVVHTFIVARVIVVLLFLQIRTLGDTEHFYPPPRESKVWVS